MKRFIHRFREAHVVALIVCMLLVHGGGALGDTSRCMPPESIAALHYLLDLATTGEGASLDVHRIGPLLSFLQSPKPPGVLYRADDSFTAPSAFHQFDVENGLQQIVDYTLDTDIPAACFWPTSLRTSRWTRVEGGVAQFERLKTAFVNLAVPVALQGEEHLSITPDQHTGAYYSYDVAKTIILAPYGNGRIMITICRQQRPSMVGKKGWVLGTDDDWSYLYTQDKGLNVNGLTWASTYLYDSFGITVYWEKDATHPAVSCGLVSWVKAGWAGINMVKPHHIKKGLIRAAHAFCGVLEDPRLPDPANLAATFSRSRNLSMPTLKAYARDYFSALERRIAASTTLRKKVGDEFDPQAMLEAMTHDEVYATLALDYLKKLLGRDPVIEAHPF